MEHNEIVLPVPFEYWQMEADEWAVLAKKKITAQPMASQSQKVWIPSHPLMWKGSPSSSTDHMAWQKWSLIFLLFLPPRFVVDCAFLFVSVEAFIDFVGITATKTTKKTDKRNRGNMGIVVDINQFEQSALLSVSDRIQPRMEDYRYTLFMWTAVYLVDGW